MARYSKLAPNTVIHVGGKPSGKEVVKRRSKLEAALSAGFVQEEGFEVTRESVLAYLDLNEDSASLLTRTLKHVFPGVSTRRRKEDGMYPLSQIVIIANFII